MRPSTLPRTLAAELVTPPDGTEVRLQGWVHRHRVLARVSFLVLRDRSGLVQVVITDAGLRAVTSGLAEESVVEVVGTLTRSAQAPGGVEVQASAVETLSPATDVPLELWRPTLAAGLPAQLDHAAVSWRHPSRRARWRVAAAAIQGFRATLDAQGFTEVQTPKIVGSATESGANVFTLDYFGRPGYLAQSPQFYKQTLVGVFERVYEVGPVFRAEPHETARHLASYTSLDVELGFVTDHRDVLAVLRDVLAAMVDRIAEHASDVGDLVLPDVPAAIPVVHFTEALRIAGADPDEPDLSPADERALGEWAVAEHGSEFLAVEGYPMVKRPFYTHPQPDDPRWSNSFDLLFRGLELVTGGQRLHRYGDYLAALAARGEDPAAYSGYLEAFAAGMPPHGGFAIGLERFVARLCGVANIREVTLFPRDRQRLFP